MSTPPQSSASSASPFTAARWVWTPGTPGKNHFALFTKSVPCEPGAVARIHICSADQYELHVNGRPLGRGPVHGDPAWRLVDSYTYVAGPDEAVLDVAVLVHHSTGTHVHCRIPGPPGLIAEVSAGNRVVAATDETWRCLDLEMWAQDVPERNWALDWCEDYDARQEPAGWGARRFPEALTAGWEHAVPAPDAEAVSSDWGPRPVPQIAHSFATPETFWTWRTESGGDPLPIVDLSRRADEEPLTPQDTPAPFSLDALNTALARGANSFTLDLGAEWVGHYLLDVEAAEGTVLEVSGAELLQEGASRRPWIFRKGSRYTARFTTREGRQELRPFFWTGCRYVHIVVRGAAEGLEFHRAGLLRRAAPLAWRGGTVRAADADLSRVLAICRQTLEVCAQEHLIDCPSREQTQYWGDGVFIAQSYAVAFGEPAYLRWYLDGFLHVPFKEGGQIASTYPGGHVSLLDYSLIPLIGQVFHRQNTGTFYKPAETAEKALRIKAWYDHHSGPDGLVTFPFAEYLKKGLINFIDHPGIGWHDFPHVGIDRDGTSCALNTFFYGFLRILADLYRDCGRSEESAAITAQAGRLGETLQRVFFDGTLFRDARREDGSLSEGASWQTNCLTVFFDLVTGEDAVRLLREMLDGYDRLCRCSPYFHFYLLTALRKAGLEREAVELIKHEWRPMLNAGATTAWEGFLGDAKDSLCHPWSTAPLLFLREDEPFRLPPRCA